MKKIVIRESKAISKVAVITNFNITEKRDTAVKVINKLISLGCKVTLPLRALERMSDVDTLEGNVEYLGFDKFYKDIEALVVLGGDGTILENARYAALNGILVLGMNLGRLGYLAEIEMNELEKIEQVIAGNYTIEERSMIKVHIKSERKGKMHCGYALNDATISNSATPKLIELELSENDSVISNYRADGIIVATPTGSTAYSMAAGGAVVDPRLNCLCVTPICPHSFNSKPLIFPDNAELEITNRCLREKSVSLTLDGRKRFDVYYGDKVCISRASTTAKFIRLKTCSFYLTLRQKLSATER